MTPSPIQLIIVLVIVLLLFGAKKIPELAKGLGTGMREFRQGASGEIEDDKDSGGESRVDKEASETPASESHDEGANARSESENAEGSSETSKTEQRS